MDCSNPVKDSTRVTVASMMEGAKLRRRQDLAHLEALARETPRVYYSGGPWRERAEGVPQQELALVREKTLLSIPSAPDIDLSFLESLRDCPVSGLMRNGVPIHPSGVNQEKGYVKAQRVFGGFKRDEDLQRHALEYFTPEEVVAAQNRFVYTRGTASGFSQRMREQMTRKCVQLSQMEAQATGGRRGWTHTAAKKRIKALFPYEAGFLPNWEAPLEEQILGTKTSNISSAGAPYWKPKPLAMKELIEVVLPIVYEAVASGGMVDLYSEQPELWLCEVKNKLDRYEPAKLAEKVRPYIALPYHFQAIFSCLSQPFTESLKLFFEQEGCANAYGFSWAHGGGAKLAAWARRAKNGDKPRFCVYGDDADIYYRRKGVLYRITPDFRQMDGSVDLETVSLTVDFIIDAYEEVYGPNEFWRRMGALWKHFATNPAFLVHGTTVYSKPSDKTIGRDGPPAADGLMTGVVGTTLFDSVKGAVAYDIWADAVMGRPELLEEQHAVPFFRKMGLEIKEGTWKPEEVLESPSDGQLWTTQKFLGMAMIYLQGPNEVEPVPWLPDEDWLTLYLTPRDDPAEGRSRKQRISDTQRLRTLFDRCRGYLITGGFSSERISQLLYSTIDQIPLVPIMMQVQAGEGKGETPESSFALDDDFRYPTSDGVPNIKWCESLYFSLPNKWTEGAEFDPVAPQMAADLEDWRQNWKPLIPRVVAESIPKRVRFGEQKSQSSAPLPGVIKVEEDPGEDALVMQGIEPIGPTPNTKELWALKDKHRPRSKVVNVKVGEPGDPIVKEEEKRLPNQSEMLWRMFAEKKRKWEDAAPEISVGRLSARGTLKALMGSENPTGVLEVLETPVIPVPELADILNTSREEVKKKAINAGLFVLNYGLGYVTDAPVSTPDADIVWSMAVQEQTIVPRVLEARALIDRIEDPMRVNYGEDVVDLRKALGMPPEVAPKVQGWTSLKKALEEPQKLEEALAAAPVKTQKALANKVAKTKEKAKMLDVRDIEAQMKTQRMEEQIRTKGVEPYKTQGKVASWEARARDRIRAKGYEPPTLPPALDGPKRQKLAKEYTLPPHTNPDIPSDTPRWSEGYTREAKGVLAEFLERIKVPKGQVFAIEPQWTPAEVISVLSNYTSTLLNRVDLSLKMRISEVVDQRPGFKSRVSTPETMGFVIMEAVLAERKMNGRSASWFSVKAENQVMGRRAILLRIYDYIRVAPESKKVDIKINPFGCLKKIQTGLEAGARKRGVLRCGDAALFHYEAGEIQPARGAEAYGIVFEAPAGSMFLPNGAQNPISLRSRPGKSITKIIGALTKYIPDLVNVSQ